VADLNIWHPNLRIQQTNRKFNKTSIYAVCLVRTSFLVHFMVITNFSLCILPHYSYTKHNISRKKRQDNKNKIICKTDFPISKSAAMIHHISEILGNFAGCEEGVGSQFLY